ncbi:dynein regulatory complex protein 10 isoform X2 [Anguilla rostrata]|uniref:dynein regulatory complex protein 10 isoform X2 n=1 Tax=Anguilla anguilla TaxID=7936 RepID=UPI0015B2575B|nr:dynein regulatory complex protein 10 isoform X2 [Anguilla anguilla]
MSMVANIRMCSKTTKEPLKILNLSGEKVKTLEMQCTIKILDECIWKMETAVLLPTILLNVERNSAVLWGGLMRVLQGHQLLEERFATQELRWQKLQGEEGKIHLAGLEQALCGSFQNVLRYLRAHPSGFQGLSREATDKGSQKLVEGLKELQGLLWVRQLVGGGPPAEEQVERDSNQYIDELSLRHRNNMEVVSTLEEDVVAATKDKDAETFKKNEVIRKLKSSMLQREKMSEDFTFRMLQDVENQNLSYRKTSEGRRANMQQDINQLCTQLKNLITKNREVEMTLRKKRNKVESEIENWIQKYDADMGEKQVELEEVSVYYAQESKELQELEEHYKVLELEFSQIMDERRLAQELKEEEERERVIKEQNAVIIQAYWRGFQVRKEMKGKPTGKKGKKGKGRKIK